MIKRTLLGIVAASMVLSNATVAFAEEPNEPVLVIADENILEEEEAIELPEEAETDDFEYTEKENSETVLFEAAEIQTGWVENADGTYYYNEDGTMHTGWLNQYGKWYYLDPDQKGVMLANTQKDIGGKKYTFNIDGLLVNSGWCYTKNGYWYVNSNGDKQTGWLLWNNKWYYLNPQNDGIMVQSDWLSYGKGKYYLCGSGEMLCGWQYIDNEWYHFNNDLGLMSEGWKYIVNDWYYLQPGSGKMLKNGWYSINNRWYYLNSSGQMLKNWQYINNNWYYLSNDGAMRTNWQSIGGKWYFLDRESGAMYTQGWHSINNRWYYMNGSGQMLTNWQSLGGKWFYFSTDGAMREGWQKIDGKWYYFYYKDDKNGGAQGTMARDTTIDGYRIDRNGVYSEAYEDAKKVLNSVGWNLKAAFDWSSSAIKYKTDIANPSPGTEWFALKGFRNREGNCYVMASTFYYMADLLGYEVHQVSGHVRYRSGALGAHSWCEVVINGHTYICDPDSMYELGAKSYLVNYGDAGTVNYQDHYRIN